MQDQENQARQIEALENKVQVLGRFAAYLQCFYYSNYTSDLFCQK